MAKIPCPFCGRLVDRLIEGMCEDCYVERHPLVKVKETRVLRCRYCGALFIRGRWIREGRGGVEELAAKVLSDKASVSGAIERIEASQSYDGLTARVVVKGSPHPSIEPRLFTYVLTFEYVYDICNSCREMLSRREVAVLQIRGYPRGIENDVKKKIIFIIEQELYKLKDKKIGFISDIKDLKNEIDIYTTNANLARHLAYVIHRQFPSVVTETAKVVGVKDGRKIYHMTYSVRIATYKPGDVIVLKGEKMAVTSINNKYVVLHLSERGRYEQLSISELLRSEVTFIGQH